MTDDGLKSCEVEGRTPPLFVGPTCLCKRFPLRTDPIESFPSFSIKRVQEEVLLSVDCYLYVIDPVATECLCCGSVVFLYNPPHGDFYKNK